MMGPSADPNAPEPPLLKRTAADLRCSAHPEGGSKPYRDLSCSSGKLLKTHIPSSAWTETDMAKPAAKSASGTAINTIVILIRAYSSVGHGGQKSAVRP